VRRRGAGPVATWLAAGVLVLAPVRTAAAQGLAGDVGAFNVQRRLSYQSAVYEQTGVAVGLAGTAHLRFVQLRVRGLFGTLKGDGTAANPDVKLRTTTAALEFAVSPWLGLGALAEARRFEADAGITTWRLFGALARLEPGLGLPGLSGLAEFALLPAGSVSNGPKTKAALQFLVGVSYRVPRSPLQVRLGYRFERYDFEASGLSPERYEQFQGVVAEAGLRLGRW
jgi:hypothetical protein